MNKEIKELRKDIAECIDDAATMPERLHAKGYRKQKVGRWVLHKPRRENRNATYKCSACGKLCSSYYNDVGAWNFCPHCGAKMKGESDE